MNAVVISQPMLFPWPGFFEQMMLAERYYFLDDVQFSKGSFINRVQIKNFEKINWMTIPLSAKSGYQEIRNLITVDDGWRDKHIAILSQAFRHAPYKKDAIRLAEKAYAKESIIDVLIESIEASASYLGIATDQYRVRTSSINVSGHSSQRVLDIVIAATGSLYITGHGAANYLDHEAFVYAGIEVDYMNYSRTPWPQSGGEFTPFVSILDLIANVGPRSADHLKPATENWRTFILPRAKTD